MSPVQWALLLVAVAAVVAIYVYSRRDQQAMNLGRSEGGVEPLLPPPDQQLDIFADGKFDEFGVGKPRRVAPVADPFAPPRAARRCAPSAAPSAVPSAASVDAGVVPLEPQPAAPAARPPVEEKIVALLVAEREGAQIDGDVLHAALREQQLEFGNHQIYHRMHQQAAVFSVASLVKPGHLDPEQSAEFHTPGLTLFMVLPGPQQPALAIRDMLDTAGRLAEALNGQVYDSRRAPLTEDTRRALQLEVEDWARRNHAG